MYGRQLLKISTQNPKKSSKDDYGRDRKSPFWGVRGLSISASLGVTDIGISKTTVSVTRRCLPVIGTTAIIVSGRSEKDYQHLIVPTTWP